VPLCKRCNGIHGAPCFEKTSSAFPALHELELRIKPAKLQTNRKGSENEVDTAHKQVEFAQSTCIAGPPAKWCKKTADALRGRQLL
jgi:hypothetical protein